MTTGWQRLWRRGGVADWVLRLLCGFMILYSVSINVEYLAMQSGVAPLAADGVGLGEPVASPSGYYKRVRYVIAGSPGEAAGLRPGDLVRYDQAIDNYRYPAIGTRIGLTVLQHEKPIRRTIIIRSWNRSASDSSGGAIGTIGVVVSIFTALLVGLLFWRGWWQPVPMLLGFALTSIGLGGAIGTLPFWAATPAIGVPLFLLLGAWSFLTTAAIPAFAMRLFEERVEPLSRWPWGVLAAGTAVMAINSANYLSSRLNLPHVVTPVAFWYYATYFIGILAGTIFYLARGWGRSDGIARNQYALLMLSVALLLATFVESLLADQLHWFQPGTPSAWVDWATLLIGSVLVPSLLAYSVLGQKLVDIGFVLNRTLVYGSISAILLVMFGLAERAADEFIQEQSRIESVIIQAGIAVGILLIFHRVRDFVEDRLEALFFRSWHENEAKLKRFIADAGHFTGREPLMRALVQELTRFTGGASVALYMPDAPMRALTRAAGNEGMPDAIEVDDPALVRLRADRKPVELGDTASDLPAGLALPMFHRAELIGLVLLGPKPRDERYRPDEVAALNGAVDQVGLDIEALRIEALEAEANRLRSRLALAETWMVPTT